MKNFFIFVAVVMVAGGLIVGGGFAYFLYTGPRMKEQPHVRAYQAAVPAQPKGVVPARARITVENSMAALAQSGAATGADLGAGKVYYTYYCVFCHGAQGDGRGPVGESYAPAPADLRSDRVRRMAPPQLLKNMLTGVGHEPVLEMVVHPEFRRALVFYVAALAQGAGARSNP